MQLMKDGHFVITNFLLEHRWLTPTGLGVLIVVGPLAGVWLVSRRKLAWLLAAGSLIPVALLTLVPVDRELLVQCALQWSWPTPGRVELMANVVLFVGPALFAGVAARRPVMVLVWLSGLSVGLEAVQALVPGFGRSCDVTDWLSNTIGAAIGAGLAAAALFAARAGRWPRASASGRGDPGP